MLHVVAVLEDDAATKYGFKLTGNDNPGLTRETFLCPQPLYPAAGAPGP